MPEGKVYCPTGGEEIPAVSCAYGHRATCYKHGQRWTRIRGEADWTEETYTAMRNHG